MADRKLLKKRISEFWDIHPCGSFASDKPVGDIEFFEDVRSFRGGTQKFVYQLVDFQQFAGKSMLEVGCGLGSDLLHAAKAGASVVGIDISRRSVGLASKQFALSGIAGQFIHGDAESLPFGNASFDVIYSFGVLHHTPDTVGAINECLRVLKSEGVLVLMLYNSTSWLTVVEPYLWRIKRFLSRREFDESTDRSEVVRRYDGEDNPLGKAYSSVEVKRMLAGFHDVRLRRRSPRLRGSSLFVKLYYLILDYSGINSWFGFWTLATARKK